jgi:predicted Fe-Mo cluster-binding NifX family protein
MKIGIVTDDGMNVSPHFGRAQFYLVYDLQNGKIAGKEMRPKSSHDHRHHDQVELQHYDEIGRESHDDHHSEERLHDNMLSAVRDCQVLVARGMGWGMYNSIRQLGIEPFITEIASAEDVVQAYLNGTLDNHEERLH